jgi:hypothetical protein
MERGNFCRACGKQNRDQARFCGYCGKPLSLFPQQLNLPVTKIVAGIVFFVFFGSLVYVWQSYFSSAPPTPQQAIVGKWRPIDDFGIEMWEFLADGTTVITFGTAEKATPGNSNVPVIGKYKFLDESRMMVEFELKGIAALFFGNASGIVHVSSRGDDIALAFSDGAPTTFRKVR